MQDHAPLLKATQKGRVIALYIIEPKLWAQPDSSRRHWHFTYDCLSELHQELAELGVQLLFRVGEVVDVFESLRQELNSFEIHSHEESGNDFTFKRDIALKKWCVEQHINWHEYPTNGIVRRLKNRDNWAKLRDERMAQPLLPSPLVQQALKPFHSDILPKQDDPLFGQEKIGFVQKGGRKEGLSLLKSFLTSRSKRYMQTISKPAASQTYCSRLSAHITYGTLSMREVVQACERKLMELAQEVETPLLISHQRNLKAFLSRLAWHCHFIQKLEQQPKIEFACMHPAFEGMREPFHNEDHLNAWREGRTGYPLIDAAMRCLHKTGWITFRMRAMLVSFASYHLWLDWRVTAPVLAKLFTDYEPGIHFSQFQMQSGVTGINAIRIYNPIKQSQDHDPEGQFILAHVPELKAVPLSFIHTPWLLETPPLAYPPPLVEHEAALKFARLQLSSRWKEQGFRQEAKAVHQKLGSRAGSSTRQIKARAKPKETKQLSLF